MNEINWKRKLTSRKFWAAVVGFITSILTAFKIDNLTVEQVTCISALGILMYILGKLSRFRKNNEIDFWNYAESWVVVVYGAPGEVMTKNFDTLANRFGRRIITSSYSTKSGSAECFDCCDLIVWALEQLGLLNTDLTADRLYQIYEPIGRKREPMIGILSELERIKTHVVYIGSSR